MEQVNKQSINNVQQTPELPQNNSHSSHPPKKAIIALGVVILILAVSAMLLMMGSNKTSEQNPTTSNNSVDKPMEKDVFTKEMPNFDNLTNKDIPLLLTGHGGGDNRNNVDIYSFNDNILLRGENTLIEYDPLNKKILRISDKNVLNCVRDSGKTDTFLYILDCLGNIVKIDLHANRIVKTFSNFKGMGALDLTANSRYLWFSSDTGVTKIDSANDQVKTFSKAEVGFPDTRAKEKQKEWCGYYDIVANEKYTWVIMDGISGCLGGAAVYHDEKWHFSPLSSFQKSASNDNSPDLYNFAYSQDEGYILSVVAPIGTVYEYDPVNAKWNSLTTCTIPGPFVYFYKCFENNRLRFFPDAVYYHYPLYYFDKATDKIASFNVREANIPAFYNSTLTNKVNGKYYIVSNDKIFVLKEGELPVVVRNLNARWGDVNDSFVDTNERFILYVTRLLYGMESQPTPYTVANTVKVGLIDVNTGNITELTGRQSDFTRPVSDEVYKKLNKIGAVDGGALDYSQEDTAIIVKEKSNNAEFMKVDLNTKKLSIKGVNY